jgi:predicted SprT family Zn-dependent metalloprotease
MKCADALDMACDLMVEHVGHGFFKWSNTKRIFGEAGFSGKSPYIKLSRGYVKVNTEAEVKNCILHEIAHILTWGDGHGKKWKAKCVELGARPLAEYDHNTFIPEVKYKLKCNDCNTQLQGWYRRPKVTDAGLYVCLHCDTNNCRIEGLPA